MGLLDIVGGLVGSAAKGSNNQALGLLGSLLGNQQGGGSTALNLVMGLVQSQGGVSGLLNTLNKSGLADQVQSWVGTGENKAVDAGEIQNALGADAISGIASKLGINPDAASGIIAKVLPEVINQITPQGKLGTENNLQQGLSSILGMLGGNK